MGGSAVRDENGKCGMQKKVLLYDKRAWCGKNGWVWKRVMLTAQGYAEDASVGARGNQDSG